MGDFKTSPASSIPARSSPTLEARPSVSRNSATESSATGSSPYERVVQENVVDQEPPPPPRQRPAAGAKPGRGTQGRPNRAGCQDTARLAEAAATKARPARTQSSFMVAAGKRRTSPGPPLYRPSSAFVATERLIFPDRNDRSSRGMSPFGLTLACLILRRDRLASPAGGGDFREPQGPPMIDSLDRVFYNAHSLSRPSNLLKANGGVRETRWRPTFGSRSRCPR